ncbi:MAG TPA: glycosyltransferase [Rhizomicrobium sp.]
MNVLVFTPTPTHPPIQGNRQRVFDICRAMQSAGAEITLLYYATEGVSPAEARQMRDAWGDVEVVFPRGFVHRQTLARYPGIDDWFDERILEAAGSLCRQKKFDLCVANYAWYSKIFEALPAEVIRVIDAHDIFGGRAEKFTELGLPPAWFHTSIAQESVGLDRADFVVAIQEHEAEALKNRTNSTVRVVGFLSSEQFLPVRRKVPGERLVVGYVGSGNPFNVASMLSFAEVVRRRQEVNEAVEFQVAGMVCNALTQAPHPFVLNGVMNSVRDFYRSVDVIINPMLGGTGLKIKSLEALSFGKPLIATADAMAGIASSHASHNLRNMDELLDALLQVAADPARLAEEETVSRRVFRDYREAQMGAFRSLWAEIESAVAERASGLGGSESLHQQWAVP